MQKALFTSSWDRVNSPYETWTSALKTQLCLPGQIWQNTRSRPGKQVPYVDVYGHVALLLEGHPLQASQTMPQASLWKEDCVHQGKPAVCNQNANSTLLPLQGITLFINDYSAKFNSVKSLIQEISERHVQLSLPLKDSGTNASKYQDFWNGKCEFFKNPFLKIRIVWDGYWAFQYLLRYQMINHLTPL